MMKSCEGGVTRLENPSIFLKQTKKEIEERRWDRGGVGHPAKNPEQSKIVIGFITL